MRFLLALLIGFVLVVPVGCGNTETQNKKAVEQAKKDSMDMLKKTPIAPGPANTKR
jgi:hypothetical protein